VTASLAITVNGNALTVPSGTTLNQLIDIVLGSSRGSAAVVDGAVVPRSQWSGFDVRAGHDVELITAVQGG
jgi:sulfur carrier protein